MHPKLFTRLNLKDMTVKVKNFFSKRVATSAHWVRLETLFRVAFCNTKLCHNTTQKAKKHPVLPNEPNSSDGVGSQSS